MTIVGFNFGEMQEPSTVSLNSVPATVASWSDKTIVATVPLYASTQDYVHLP